MNKDSSVHFVVEVNIKMVTNTAPGNRPNERHVDDLTHIIQKSMHLDEAIETAKKMLDVAVENKMHEEDVD